MWRVDSMMQFLANKINFWRYLFDYLDIPKERTGETKPILKEAIYSLCFGMEERYIRSSLTKAFNRIGLAEKSAKFVTQPHLHALLEAREREIARITQQGGERTCYGKELLVSGDLQPRDILAQMAQAVEMQIIFPAFELAADCPKEFKLMIYQ